MFAARSAALLLLLVAAPAGAQPAVIGQETLRGVVWTPPDDPERAAADLRAMRDYGVEAVRLPASDDARVLAHADGLGLSLFMDLPVEHLPASVLLDTLGFVQRGLDGLLALAERHPSIRAVGLAHNVDTSHPLACRYFEDLAERARAGGLATYYRTSFIEADRCSAAVDLVLVDARGRDPMPLLARWRGSHETPGGIGALGVEVRDATQGGHLTPGSPPAQARFLENALRDLLTARPSPPLVFVHRWRDGSYGLHAADGSPRTAARVVAGFYTGRQTVFAIDAGPEPPAPPGATSFMILGWTIALLLIALLSFAHRIRELIPRYFARHNYYREAVQRSASLEGVGALGMAVALSLAAGVVVGVMLFVVSRTGALDVALAGLGELERQVAIDALRRPLLTVVVGGIFYGVWLLVNIVWLRALAGRRYRVRPLQATVLAVFSRWQVFVLAVLALLAAQSDEPIAWLPWLLGGWILVEIYALIRTLYDYSKVSRVPMSRAVLAGLGGALGLLALLTLAVIITAGPRLSFIWHLATRT